MPPEPELGSSPTCTWMSDVGYGRPVSRSLSYAGGLRSFVVATVWCLVDRLGLLLVAACPPEHAAVSGENDA